ncbi:MAG: homoserine kinase [SAR324 cluster bacterium]|nr:homoserine kinase [SAR324 cluster bacterium]
MIKSISLKIPASSANLGPGFDCVAVALNLYTKFTAQLTTDDKFSISYPAAIPKKLITVKNNLVLDSYQKTCRKHHWPIKYFKLTCSEMVPFESGLGSSATAIVGGIVIAYAFNMQTLNRHKILDDAYDIENHPDNIAAAIFGGFTCAFHQDKGCYLVKTPITKNLHCLIIRPSEATNTKTSRQKLLKEITLTDAKNNLARAVTMVASIINGEYENLQESMLDLMHEPYRINPKCQYPALKKKLLGKEFYGWSLSGSGPSVIILASKNSKKLKTTIFSHFRSLEMKIDLLELIIDNEGFSYST